MLSRRGTSTTGGSETGSSKTSLFHSNFKYGSLSLGIYNNSPFLSVSPVFEAYKDFQGIPEKNSRVFNSAEKIFFPLDFASIEKLLEGLRLLEAGVITAFVIERTYNDEKSYKSLTIGKFEDYPLGYLSLNSSETDQDGNVRENEIFYDLGEEDTSYKKENSSILVVNHGGTEFTEMQVPWLLNAIKSFLEETRIVAMGLKIVTAERSNNTFTPSVIRTPTPTPLPSRTNTPPTYTSYQTSGTTPRSGYNPMMKRQVSGVQPVENAQSLFSDEGDEEV